MELDPAAGRSQRSLTEMLPRRLVDKPPWLVRINRAGFAAGAGVLVDDRHIVTCAHVVAEATNVDYREPLAAELELSVSLVNVDGWDKARVAKTVTEGWRPVDQWGRGDIAVLRLADPVVEAIPAPLRAPEGLAGHRYVVRGFPGGRLELAEATGELRGRVGPASEWVQLDDPRTTGHLVDHGFSGAPVWDESLQSVVGIVVAREADEDLRVGHMIPLTVAIQSWPPLSGLIGWRLDLDDELRRHWLPRARGVEDEDGWYFTGRRRVLDELAAWLASAPGKDRTIRVVTGSPGSGKSAVIARTVLLADRRLGPTVPGVPADARPPPGSIDVAVHARGRTAGEIVQLVAAAADVEAADDHELREALRERGRPFTVVVDALDEAQDPQEIARLLSRLAADPGGVGTRVLVGTRAGSQPRERDRLVEQLGRVTLLDLDVPLGEVGGRTVGYLDHADIVEYVHRRLLMTETPDRETPYGDDTDLARRVADAVARRANGNFLIARLTSDALVQAAAPVDTTQAGWERNLPGSIGEAFRAYIERRFGEQAESVRELLTPLAFAEGDGLEADALWIRLANALCYSSYSERERDQVLDGASSYIVRQTTGRRATYRLFHAALAEHLRDEHLRRHPGQEVADLLFEALVASVPSRAGERDWLAAPPYVQTHLAKHAAAAGRLDDVLVDPKFLLAADPARLLSSLGGAESQEAREVARVYRLAAPVLVPLEPEQRADHLRLVAQQTGAFELARRLEESDLPFTWFCRVLSWNAPAAHTVLAQLPTLADVGLGFDESGTLHLLAEGAEGKLQLWRLEGEILSLVTEEQGHRARVSSLAVAAVPGRVVGVSGDDEGWLRFWDVGPGDLTAIGEPQRGWGRVDAIAVGPAPNGCPLVVTGGNRGIQVWRVSESSVAPVGERQTEATTGFTALAVGLDRDLGCVVVSAGEGHGQVRLSRAFGEGLVEVGAAALAEPQGGRWEAGPGPPVTRVTAVPGPDGRLWVVTECVGNVQLWRVSGDGLQPTEWSEDAGPNCLAACKLGDGRSLVAAGTVLGALVAWQLGDSRLLPLVGPLPGHEGLVVAVAVGETAVARPVAVTIGMDGVVRMWDLAEAPAAAEGRADHDDTIQAVALHETGDGDVYVLAGHENGVLTLWRFGPDGFEPVGEPAEPADEEALGLFVSVAMVGDGAGRVLALSADDDRVRLWSVDDNGLRLLDAIESPDMAFDGATYSFVHGDEVYFFATYDDNEIRAWRVDGDRLVGVEGGEMQDKVISVGASALPEGAALVAGGALGGLVQLWRLEPDALRPATEPSHAHMWSVTGVAVRRYGDTVVVVTGGGDRALSAWRLTEGSLKALGSRDAAHAGQVTLIELFEGPDGQRVIVTGGTDGALRFWWLQDDGGLHLDGEIFLGSEPIRLDALGSDFLIWCRAGCVVLGAADTPPVQ